MATTAVTTKTTGLSSVGNTNQYVEDIEYLRQLFRAKNLVNFSIGQIACSAGSSSGDNYMSLVKRVTIHDAAGDSQMGMEAA